MLGGFLQHVNGVPYRGEGGGGVARTNGHVCRPETLVAHGLGPPQVFGAGYAPRNW